MNTMERAREGKKKEGDPPIEDSPVRDNLNRKKSGENVPISEQKRGILSNELNPSLTEDQQMKEGESYIEKTKKELDKILEKLKEKSVSDKKKAHKAETDKADKQYIRQHLNFILPEVNERTGITQNFRFYGPIEKIVMEKKGGSDDYTRKYNEDEGKGFADFMRILFPSSDGKLNITGGSPKMSKLDEDCQPTPELCAKISAFIYKYRKMNQKDKASVSGTIENLTKFLGREKFLLNKTVDRKEQEGVQEHFDGITQYINYGETYEEVSKVWEKFCKVKQRSLNIEEGELGEAKKANGIEKKYLEAICRLGLGIKKKTINAASIQLTFENYTNACNFFNARKDKWTDEIAGVKEIQNFFRDYMSEDHFFVNGENIRIGKLKKANTILQLLQSATKAIDTQECNETNATEKCIPQYTVEKMFMGYVLQKLTKDKEREKFQKEAERLIQIQNEGSQVQDQVIEEELKEVEEILKLLKDNQKRFSPYDTNPVSYGKAKGVNLTKELPQKAKFGGKFSDCADTAMRHTLNLLGYPLKKNWDIYIQDMEEGLKEKLPEFQSAVEHGKEVDYLSLKERLQLYFYYQSQKGVGANDGGDVARGLWAYVVSNMTEDHISPEGIRESYPIKYANKRNEGNELKSGYLNFLKTFYNIAAVIKKDGKGQISQQDAEALKGAAESITKLEQTISANEQAAREDALTQAIQKVYQLINPNRTDIGMQNVTSNGQDIFATVGIEVGCGENCFIRFITVHKDGHAEVQHEVDAPEINIKKEIKGEYAKLLVQKLKLTDEAYELNTFHSLYGDFAASGDGEQFEELSKKERILKFVRKSQAGELSSREKEEAMAKRIQNGTLIEVKFADGQEQQSMEDFVLNHCVDNMDMLRHCVYDEDLRWIDVRSWKIEDKLRNHEGNNYYVYEGVVYALRGGKAAVFGWNEGKKSKNTELNIPSEVEKSGKTYRVTEIKKGAFEGNYTTNTLDNVTIPPGVTKIEEKAFYGRKINNLQWGGNSNLEEIGKSAFEQASITGVLVIPKSVTKIGDKAFAKCWDITHICFEEGSKLQEIGESAFAGHKFEKLKLPSSIKKIGKRAFEGSQMESLCFEEGGNLQVIEDSTFKGAAIGGKLVIPKSVKKIGESAFEGCQGIKRLRFEKVSNLEEIWEKAFFNTSIEGQLTIPKSVLVIASQAFAGCTGITDIRFKAKENLEQVAEDAFGDRKV